MCQYVKLVGVESWYQLAANKRERIESRRLTARWFRMNPAAKLPGLSQ